MCKRRRLRQSIALNNLNTGFVLQLASRIERHWSSAGEDILDRLHLAEIDRCIGKRKYDWRHSEVVGHFMLFAQFQRLQQVKAFHHDLRPTTGEEAAGQHDAIDMIERQEDEGHVIEVGTQGSSELQIVADKVAMGEHGSL